MVICVNDNDMNFGNFLFLFYFWEESAYSKQLI